MDGDAASSELIGRLNAAMGRELQVCIQYMLQHAIGAGRRVPESAEAQPARQSKFVASHSSYWLPGATLKKIAITEMRHAEAIGERIVALGGEPTTRPDAVTIGATIKEMLEVDRREESGAIELYRQIIELAENERDVTTLKLFRRILSDEETHHRMFSGLLADIS
jgi:bacterioferritin